MTLEIDLLGPFAARRDGTAVAVPSKRGRVLIAALALAPGQRLTRDRAVALLWPDRDEAQGRASLRQELSALRRALGAEVFESDAEAICLCRDAVRTDVARLRDPATDPGEALALVQGPLLDGLDLPQESVEEWLVAERRALDARAVTVAEALVALRLAAKDMTGATEAADRLATLDPLNETAVAAGMRAAAAAGRGPEALRLFEAHAARLADELGAAPGAELAGLRAEIAGGGPAIAPAPEEAIFDRPSVLLMGFDALSPDEDDRLLALGLAEEIRTTLSYWRWFPVIGPEAVGWRTARDGDLREIAAGVRAAYVVSGTVRRAGDRVRIAANLAEAATGRLVWSQQIDGTLADIFELQEQASRAIVAQLEPELAHAEAGRIAKTPPGGLATWQLFLAASESQRGGGSGYGTPEANAEQMRLMHEILERNPSEARAWGWLSRGHWRDTIMGWAADREAALQACIDASERSMALDPTESEGCCYHALALLFGRRQYAAAELHASEAVRLNPSAVQARHALGCVLENIGRPDEALEHLHAVFRLNPNHEGGAAVLGDIVTCNMLLGAHDDAVVAARRLVAMAPAYSRGLQRAAAAFAHAGATDDAADAVAKLFAAQPDFSEDYVRGTYPFARTADLEALVDGLRRAGALG